MHRSLDESNWRHVPTAVAVVALALLPVTFGSSDYDLLVMSTAGVYTLVATGTNVLAGYLGQASIGQGALVAVGAYTSGILATDHGWSFWLAALAGCVASLVAGLIMAIPAYRVSHWYFATLTLFVALVVPDLLVQARGVTHGFAGLIGIEPPEVGGATMSGKQYYWLIWLIVGVAALVTRNLMKSRVGEAMSATRSVPVGAQSVGISLRSLRLFAFAFSSVCAGAAGVLLGPLDTIITPDNFPTDFSILILVTVIVGGGATLWGPLIGVLIFYVAPLHLSFLTDNRLIAYGVALLLIMILLPRGIAGSLRASIRRMQTQRQSRPSSEAERVGSRSGGVGRALPASRPTSLEVEGVSKRFGGVQALDDVSFTVPGGSVLALVGPNGSGKTTMLNCISGVYTADTGRFALDGKQLAKGPRLPTTDGIGRTFQTPQLMPDESVLVNVLLGSYARQRSPLAAVALGLPAVRRERRALEREALDLLTLVGLDGRAISEAADLNHSQQRLVEIARALMSHPRVLFMDEPAAGLSSAEIAHLSTLIGTIRQSGVSVLLVEHQLELVSSVADSVVLLNFGSVLTTGSVRDVFADERVVEAYLGRSR